MNTVSRRIESRASGHGFTLIELMVVQVVVIIMFGVLFGLFGQARYLLNRGTAKLEMQQRIRQALVRVIPYVSSAMARPMVRPFIVDEEDFFPDDSPLSLRPVISPLPPDPLDDPLNPDMTDSTSNQVILRSTEQYVRKILRQTPLAEEFDPRNPFPLDFTVTSLAEAQTELAKGIYRIRFELDPDEDNSDPDLQFGNLWLDGNTDGTDQDDILLASRLHNVEFTRLDTNAIDVTVEVRAYLPTSGGGTIEEREPDRLVRSTRIYFPANTNAPGGNT